MMIIFLMAITIIMGAVIQINLIGARAFLVSQLDPIVAVYTGILAGLLSTLFFRTLSTPKFKYAYLAAILCAAQTITYGVLYKINLEQNTLAIIWITCAAFSIGIGKWVTAELANKYLDPPRAQSFFSYLSSFLGIGFIISFLIIKTSGITLSPKETLLTSSVLYFLAFILIAIGFFPKKVLEINFEKYNKEEVDVEIPDEQVLKRNFALLCFFIGAINITFTYLINVQIKQNLQSFDQMNKLINNFTLFSSLLIVVAGFALGQIIKHKRTSPLKIIIFSKATLLFLTILCLVFRNFELFIILEISQKFIGQSLVASSMQQIINSFINSHKKIFISIQQFFYFTLSSPLLAGIFYFSSKLSHEHEITLLCSQIILFTFLGFIVFKKFELYYKTLLIAYVRSNIFVAKILATQMLSFLRPNNFVKIMRKELNKEQQNFLRKTIIIGLGYSTDGSTTEIIKDEFSNEKEEVQIAVLEALSTQERFEGISFLMDILSMKVLPKSFQVRLNATKLIAKLYDVKAIPIILEGLNDSDERVIANVLETLSLFKNKDLIKYFIKFSNHNNARIRANALMGCYKYKETRAIYNEIIKEGLENDDKHFLPSFFYIIGALKDKTFLDKLKEIAKNGEIIPQTYIAPLAYALICNKQKEGNKLGIECFKQVHEDQKEISFTHFFSQLNKVQRFDFIRDSFRYKNSTNPIKTHLENSRFDFQEEVEYLNVLIKSGM